MLQQLSIKIVWNVIQQMSHHRKHLIHPQYIILVLIIGGITSLFLGFTASYIYNRVQQGVAPVSIPPLFYFNTLLIVGSSITLIYAKKMYKDDNTFMFKISLGVTLCLSLAFLGMQVIAWRQLMDLNIGLASSTMASYMYLISGLHFLHLLAGIPFLVYFILEAQKRMKDPVTVLIYFTDPDRRRVLSLLNIYWHFLDGLWIYLVLFFLINYLI